MVSTAPSNAESYVGEAINKLTPERAAKLDIVASQLSGVKPKPVQRTKRADEPAQFIYSLSSTTKYHILLDQTSTMGQGTRWTNVNTADLSFDN